MAKKKKVPPDFEQECRRIALKQMPQIEAWLERLGKSDPAEAIKAWVQISEFAHAKKARDHKMPTGTTINILMEPAQRKKIEAPEDNFIDISENQKDENE